MCIRDRDDGTITATMDGSNHAIGLELQSGVEVLIHIGVDTVQDVYKRQS